ncbi:MAG TPA: amidase family protein, partial [Actinomycetota bacterium]|nr:amidase family protein [Actinomycetota bacterium]
MDPCLGSATALADALARKKLSSRELLELYLQRVDKLNPELNAVVTLDVERAMVRATELDEILTRSGPVGPLHGLPITVKDCFETAGIRTTAGAKEFADHVPERDADAVMRLKAAGAVVFGKTNTP